MSGDFTHCMDQNCTLFQKISKALLFNTFINFQSLFNAFKCRFPEPNFTTPHATDLLNIYSQDQHNALSAKCYGLLMRAKSYAPFPQPLQKTNSSPLTPTTSPGVMPPGWPGINPELFSRIKTLSSPENSTAPHLGEKNCRF